MAGSTTRHRTLGSIARAGQRTCIDHGSLLPPQQDGQQLHQRLPQELRPLCMQHSLSLT